jgi:hypothetical protein
VRSDAAADRLIPAQARCEACHDVAAARAGEATDPPAGCAVCHLGYDPASRRPRQRSSFPPPQLTFSHAKHLARLGGGDPHAAGDAACARCHGDLRQVELATRAQLPIMDTCLSCHDGRAAPDACATCHVEPGERRPRAAR